jgi:ankyrin repeat protein
MTRLRKSVKPLINPWRDAELKTLLGTVKNFPKIPKQEVTWRLTPKVTDFNEKSRHAREFRLLLEKKWRLFIEELISKKSPEVFKRLRFVVWENDDGDTPLHLAVASDFPACVKFVLKLGAHKNFLNNMGFTPLMIAILENKKNIAEILLQAGANANASVIETITTKEEEGEIQTPMIYSPLNFAVYKNYWDLVVLLMKHGACPSYELLQMACNNTELYEALKTGYEQRKQG